MSIRRVRMKATCARSDIHFRLAAGLCRSGSIASCAPRLDRFATSPWLSHFTFETRLGGIFRSISCQTAIRNPNGGSFGLERPTPALEWHGFWLFLLSSLRYLERSCGWFCPRHDPLLYRSGSLRVDPTMGRGFVTAAPCRPRADRPSPLKLCSVSGTSHSVHVGAPAPCAAAWCFTPYRKMLCDHKPWQAIKSLRSFQTCARTEISLSAV